MTAPYYVLPSEVVQEALEKVKDGEEVAAVMAWLYENSDGKEQV